MALQALPSMPDWPKSGAPPASTHAAVHLPSFHAYPLPYVTTIGEYLMTLPQQVGGGGVIGDRWHLRCVGGGEKIWGALIEPS